MKPIPFRQRLVVRLAVGMIGVALVSLLLIFFLQFITLALSDIQPPRLKESLDEIVKANPDDPQILELVETPIRVRNLMLRASLAGLFIAGILWIIFAIRFAKSIAQPIEVVTLASAQITRGDLATRVQMPKHVIGEPAQLLEHFNEMATSLETYERERSEMIASIAHELRTPLAVTRSRLELMEEGLIDLNQAEVKRMMRQIELLTRLVNDLRTLSLADANKLSLKLKELDLAELVKDVTESLEAKATEQGVALELRLSPVRLYADSERLVQVLSNLLDNALQHTPEGGSITIKLKPEGRFALLSISDTGTGFDVDAKQLFQRFYTTHKNHQGTGLGLALVKTLVELHKGSVHAESLVGQGSRFTIKLPLAQPGVS